MRAGAVADLARQVGADVVMERYYNFGGEGVAAARQLGVPSVLEVNAPVIDYPGSTKSRLDRAVLVEPMRRWRDSLCRQAALLVTPNAQILPSWLEPAQALGAHGGAALASFPPAGRGPPPFPARPAAGV